MPSKNKYILFKNIQNAIQSPFVAYCNIESELLYNKENNSYKHKYLLGGYKYSFECKYSFEISKICILSLSTGLSFINAFVMISLIFIPVIDTIKNNSDVDHRLYESKLKKKFT